MPSSEKAGAGRDGTTRFLRTLDRVISRVERSVLLLACMLIFVMMLLIAADAVSRYLFNSPLGFTFDVVTMYLLPGAMFFAMAYTLRRAGHVNVDLFLNFLPPHIANLVTGVTLLLALPMIAIMAWQMGGKTWESWTHGDMVTGLYAWPIWLSEITVPIGMTMLSLRLLHMGLVNLFAAFSGRTDLAIPVTPGVEVAAEDAI